MNPRYGGYCKWFFCAVVISFGTLIAAGRPAPPPPTYTITALGMGGRALNNRGEVVGAISQGERYVAAVWRNGKTFSLGTLGGSNSFATAMNDHGLIVGMADTATGRNPVPFLYEKGRMWELKPRYADGPRDWYGSVTISAITNDGLTVAEESGMHGIGGPRFWQQREAYESSDDTGQAYLGIRAVRFPTFRPTCVNNRWQMAGTLHFD